ncbi:MAG: flippase-like domain-containing protein [Candidatus Kapabacteria bacterium]|nr:flippase-like domain-containing protein [Candidatus Kapabacteria bacterium]
MRFDNRIIKYIVATAILALSLYLSARQIAFDELLIQLQGLDYVWVLFSIPAIIASNIIRALRWREILAPISSDVKVHNAFSAIMIGHLLNSFTLRFGELARPIILAKKEKLPTAAVISTAVLEGGVDFAFLNILFLVSLVFLSEPLFKLLNFDSVFQGSLGIFIIVLVVIATLFFIYRFRHPIWNLLKSILPAKFTHKFEDSMSAFVQGFVSLKSPLFYFKMTFYTILLWLSYALIMYLVFFAFQFQSAIHLSFIDSIILVVFAGIATAIAFTPGAVGVYHLVVASIMTTLYSITSNEAFAYATIIHIITLLVQSCLGAIYLIYEGINTIRISEIENSSPNS